MQGIQQLCFITGLENPFVSLLRALSLLFRPAQRRHRSFARAIKRADSSPPLPILQLGSCGWTGDFSYLQHGVTNAAADTPVGSAADGLVSWSASSAAASAYAGMTAEETGFTAATSAQVMGGLTFRTAAWRVALGMASRRPELTRPSASTSKQHRAEDELSVPQ